MNYSARPKILLVVLLAISLGLKLTPKPENLDAMKGEIVGFLEAHRFRVVESEESLGGMPILEADAGECRMKVLKASALGWNRDMIRGIAADGDTIFSVFEGQVYAEQPDWRSAVSYSLSKLMRNLGLTSRTTYVLAVVASANCDAQALPWRDLSRGRAAAS